MSECIGNRVKSIRPQTPQSHDMAISGQNDWIDSHHEPEVSHLIVHLITSNAQRRMCGKTESSFLLGWTGQTSRALQANCFMSVVVVVADAEAANRRKVHHQESEDESSSNDRLS